MAGIACPTFLRGRRMRVTRLDNAGRPVYGAQAFVVTAGFVSVELGAEVEDGEETTVTNASGEICVSEKSPDQVKWRNITMTFCQVDPDLIQMINPTAKKVLDGHGNTVGWRTTQALSGDAGFALEIWTDLANVDATVVDPDGEGAWGYVLLPWCVGGAPGDLTIENGALSFVFNGTTKVGGGWGVGPYNITMANAKCGPLLTPILSDEDSHIQIVSCKPPVAACGAQLLASPPKIVSVLEDTTDDTRMTVKVTAVNDPVTPAKELTVYYGDGTAGVKFMPPAVPAPYKYANAGTYTIEVQQDTGPRATHQVTVPFTTAQQDPQ